MLTFKPTARITNWLCITSLLSHTPKSSVYQMVLKHPFTRLLRHHILQLANIHKHPVAINHVSDMHEAFEAFPEAVHALSQ